MKKLFLVFTLGATAWAQTVSFSGGPALDALLTEAVRTGEIPGAVVVVGHAGQKVYERAYGYRALVPAKEPMTLDTIFDAASLTKVVATTSSILKLVEEGKIRLNDPVTKYLPEFQGGKSDITVRHLMTHFSGLRPDLDLKPAWSGYETGIQKALMDRPINPPGVKFVYSDINYILLGEIVRRVSGQSLPQYAHDRIFAPLGMNESMFQPPLALRARIAPTELDEATKQPFRGIVHDETTRFMGGVAGHAGLFTTAADLSKFAEMLLGLGQRQGVRVFSPLTVRKATSPQTPADQPVLRGLGWDIESPFSSNRGDLFPVGSYGHTGFTGTSMWMDPYTNSYVILLTNSVHPHRKTAIVSLRSRVATIAAAGLGVDVPPTVSMADRPKMVASQLSTGNTLTGLDVLVEQHFASLKGKRVGLITNHTGLTRDGKRDVDVLLAGGVKVTALFSPEHGIAGVEDRENIGNSKDAASGIPVFSLYAGNKHISDEMLKNVDTLVFDIQDIGARFYTYSCTMAYSLEDAAKRQIPYIVLDRPNPITGTHVESVPLDSDLKSFVGCLDVPLRHGMTIGELARFHNASLPQKADLQVITMKNWHRSDWFDATGLPWVNPSPNMRSLNAAILYPGIGMLEGGKVYSVGRGTDAPFEQVGADWMDGRELANFLNARGIPGLRVYPTKFQPSTSNFAGKTIEGIRFVITDRDSFNSTRFGLELGSAIAKLFPGKMSWQADSKLVGNRAVLKGLESGQDAAALEAMVSSELNLFRQKRVQALLY